MKRTIAVLLALATFPLVAQPAPPPARFCIGAPASDLLAGDCRDVTSDAIEVAPAPKTRAWAHLDGARKVLTLGTLDPDATKIELGRRPGVMLSISGSANRDWPADTTLTLASKASQWTATIPAKVVATLRGISLADGTYDLRLAAPHHLPLERKGVKFRADAATLLGELSLQPRPRLRATFVDKEGAPVADVRVTTPDGTLLATSNATGDIDEELQQRLGERLFARRSGFANKTFELSKPVDVSLGRVMLSSGATLTIDVERNDYAGRITASLIRTHEHTVGKRTTFASQRIEGTSSQLVLGDLEARDYILILRGEEPLQAIVRPLSLAEAEKKSITIPLDSYRVRAFIHRGSNPYDAGKVSFTQGNAEWSAETTTDAHGRLSSEAWFKGPVSISVDRAPNTFYRAIREVSAPLNEWDIELPDRKITGVVVDKATGKPLPKASVSLRFQLNGPEALGGARNVALRDDATFELDMLEPGSFDIDARLDPFLRKVEHVELTPSDRVRAVRLELEEGKKVRVQVLDHTGRPAIGAEVLGTRGADRQRFAGRWQTDASGIATISLQENEVKTMWAVTQYDTFAQFTVRAADAGTKPISVSLPPPVATLVVRAVREDGTPVPGVHIFTRHNGVFLDDDVRMYYFGAVRRTPMRTGADGTITLTNMPVGTYELWGWETPAMNVGSDGRPMGNVARVNAMAGQNEVRLVMEQKQAK